MHATFTLLPNFAVIEPQHQWPGNTLLKHLGWTPLLTVSFLFFSTKGPRQLSKPRVKSPSSFQTGTPPPSFISSISLQLGPGIPGPISKQIGIRPSGTSALSSLSPSLLRSSQHMWWTSSASWSKCVPGRFYLSHAWLSLQTLTWISHRYPTLCLTISHRYLTVRL